MIFFLFLKFSFKSFLSTVSSNRFCCLFCKDLIHVNFLIAFDLGDFTTFLKPKSLWENNDRFITHTEGPLPFFKARSICCSWLGFLCISNCTLTYLGNKLGFMEQFHFFLSCLMHKKKKITPMYVQENTCTCYSCTWSFMKPLQEPNKSQLH